VDAGWRVVAPFMRGYAPTSLPSDSSYHVGALMDDALRVLDAAGPTGRDVFIGHGWGAIAGAALGYYRAAVRGGPSPAMRRNCGQIAILRKIAICEQSRGRDWAARLALLEARVVAGDERQQ